MRTDRNLCDAVSLAAGKEFHYTRLCLEDAIVLLGRERLCALLSTMIQRSAMRHTSAFHRNRITPTANPCRLETFQGEHEK